MVRYSLSAWEAVRRAAAVVLTTTDDEGRARLSPPVKLAMRGGRGYLALPPDSVVLAHLRREPRLLVAPATPRGRATGPAMDATAELLDDTAAQTAAREVSAEYGLLARLTRRRADVVHLRIVPVRPAT